MPDTVIGSSIVIEGEVSGDGSLVVLGTIKGKIAIGDSLSVAESGVVEADIETKVLTIGGQVKGSVVAREKVELQPHGRLVGDIKAPRVVIAEGAALKGTVDMDV